MDIQAEQCNPLFTEKQTPGFSRHRPPPPLENGIKAAHGSAFLGNKIKRIFGIFALIFIGYALMGINPFAPLYRGNMVDNSSSGRIPEDAELVWRPRLSCRDTPYTLPKKTFYARLAPDRELFLEQVVAKREPNSPGGRVPYVEGEVVLRPAKTDADAALEVEIISNIKDAEISVDFDTSGDGHHLKITTPQSVPYGAGGGSSSSSSRNLCIQMRITARIPRGALVKALGISTTSLDIFAQDGLALGAESSIDLSTAAGNIVFPDGDEESGPSVPVPEPYRLQSPRYTYATVSGNVGGWFPSYHSLKITTESGAVTARITNKDDDDGRYAQLPLLLEVESVSGELKITDESTTLDAMHSAAGTPNKVLARDHDVKISTKSGAILASLFIGSSSTFSSISGHVRLNLFPVVLVDDDECPPPNDSRRRQRRQRRRQLLKTTTTSGGQQVHVHEPSLFLANRATTAGPDSDDRKNLETTTETEDRCSSSSSSSLDRNRGGLTSLDSRHKSITGNMLLVYPDSWAGKFEAKALSSSINIHGKHVVIDKNKGGFVGRTVAGHKGHVDGSSTIQMDQTTGNIDLWIGSD